jgi:hypothetical protein
MARHGGGEGEWAAPGSPGLGPEEEAAGQLVDTLAVR